MNSLAKAFVGLLIAVAGIAWYIAPGFSVGDVVPFDALKTVAVGSFGVFLFVFGALMAWVEYEDWKWEQKEKEELAKAKKRTRATRKRRAKKK